MVHGRFEFWVRQEVLGPVVRRAAPLIYWAAYLWRRLLFRTTFIGVTGSLGKTTTKELLAGILSTRWPTFRTYRNQNATAAVALNILRVRPWHRLAVLEVAAAAPNSMRRSASLLRPDAAIILNVLNTHSTEYASLEQHAAEKEELLRWVRPGGFAVLNVDDDLVHRMAAAAPCRIVTAGASRPAGYRATRIAARWPQRLSFHLEHAGHCLRVQTQLAGAHWQPSVAAAIALAHSLGFDLEQAVEAAAKTPPFAGRLQPVQVPGGAVFLRDDYNASIDTIETSVRILEEAAAARRLLVITDLSDFGKNRKQRLKYLAGLSPRAVEALVLVGESADYGRRRAIDQGLAPDHVHAFADIQSAAEFLRRELRAGDLALLKGRTTDHAARLFFAQIGNVGCWKQYCPKRMLCDICWELDVTPEQMKRAVLVPPPTSSPAPPTVLAS